MVYMTLGLQICVLENIVITGIYLFKKIFFKCGSFLKNIFIDYAITVVPFPPLHSTPSCPSSPSHIPPPIVHVHGSYV